MVLRVFGCRAPRLRKASERSALLILAHLCHSFVHCFVFFAQNLRERVVALEGSIVGLGEVDRRVGETREEVGGQKQFHRSRVQILEGAVV